MTSRTLLVPTSDRNIESVTIRTIFAIKMAARFGKSFSKVISSILFALFDSSDSLDSLILLLQYSFIPLC